MCGHRRTDGLLADYCDGSDFLCHPLYSREKNSLQIMIYYDDVEVCDPLGHVCLFYYTIGNLSPYLRSQLISIQLLAVAKTTVINKYGIDTILEPFMKELRILEEVK